MLMSCESAKKSQVVCNSEKKANKKKPIKSSRVSAHFYWHFGTSPTPEVNSFSYLEDLILAVVWQDQNSRTLMSEIQSTRRYRGTKKEDCTHVPSPVQRKSDLGELIQQYWERGGLFPQKDKTAIWEEPGHENEIRDEWPKVYQSTLSVSWLMLMDEHSSQSLSLECVSWNTFANCTEWHPYSVSQVQSQHLEKKIGCIPTTIFTKKVIKKKKQGRNLWRWLSVFVWRRARSLAEAFTESSLVW